MPPRKRPSAVAVAKPVNEEEPGSGSDMEADTPSSRRRSTRTPKPVVRKSMRDESDSEENPSDEDQDSDGGSKKGKKAPARKTPAKKSGTSTGGTKRPASNGSGGKNAKKARQDASDDDFSEGDDGEDDEFDEQEEGAPKSKPRKSNGANGGASAKKKKGKDDDEEDDEDEEYDLDFEDDEVEDPNWVEPDYLDKEWFKTNCLLCQICKKTYDHTGEALKCFHKHKDRLRCYVCFLVLKGGKDGTKRLFKHYQNRHQVGDKPSTVKCPHCNESFAFKSVSCHIISIHFREALGLPDKAKAGTENGSAKNYPKKNGNKKSAGEDEEDGDEEEEDVDDEEEED